MGLGEDLVMGCSGGRPSLTRETSLHRTRVQDFRTYTNQYVFSMTIFLIKLTEINMNKAWMTHKLI